MALQPLAGPHTAKPRSRFDAWTNTYDTGFTRLNVNVMVQAQVIRLARRAKPLDVSHRPIG